MVTTIPVGVDVLGDPCTNGLIKTNGGRGNPSPTDDLGNLHRYGGMNGYHHNR